MMVTLVAIAIVALFAVLGYVKGLIMTVWRMLGLIIVLVLTVIIAPQIANGLKSSEKIFNSFYSKAEQTINLNIDTANGTEVLIKDMHLPSSVEDKLLAFADEYSEDAAANDEAIKREIYTKVANSAITGIAYIGTLIVIAVVAFILVRMLNLVSKLPVLNATNKLAGLCLGIVEGILIIWIFCGIAPTFAGTEVGRSIIDQVNANVFLRFLYEHNLLTTILSVKSLGLLSKK